MYSLKCALIVEKRITESTGGFDNLALTAKAIDADLIPYSEINLNAIKQYQCVIVIDNKDYRKFGMICSQIRTAHPSVLLGWHQESEVSNIFRRHKCHDDLVSSEESFCIASLKVWDNIKHCDFIIVHNAADFSCSFYWVFGQYKPIFSLPPFLPINEMKQYYKSQQEKEKLIYLGFNYNWREGGFLSYLIAGQKQFREFELVRRYRGGKIEEGSKEHEVMSLINNNFYKVPVTTLIGSNRIELAKLFARCYVALNLREPTACRTNAVCAAVGTPMIGNEQSDTQRILFPDLCMNKYDLFKGTQLLTRLINDTGFYTECVNKAQKNLINAGIDNSAKILQKEILEIWKRNKV